MDEPNGPLPELLALDADTRPAWKRTVLFGCGVICIVIGVICGPIPIMTGIPFYIGGAVLLGMSNKHVAAWINRWERKLPRRARLMLRRTRREKR